MGRLARLIRLLKFNIFIELKQMVLGVITGMRVLGWAVVLLGMVIFFLGVCARKFIGLSYSEFSSLNKAMFTIFRCVTDGCTSYNGAPLQERLRSDFVTVG